MRKITVLFLVLIVAAFAVGAEAAEVQTPSRRLDVSDNPFIALRQLEEKTENSDEFSNPQRTQCYLLEERVLIAGSILENYFDDQGVLTEKGEKYWSDVPIAGVSCRYGFERSFAARAYTLVKFMEARQELDFCRR